MKKGWLIFGAIVVVLLISAVSIFGWVTGNYNRMVTLEETVNNAFARVQSDYQRRFDLIPNLVETVKGAAAQERAVFTGVAEARAKVGQFTVTPEILNNPQALQQFNNIQGELSSALTRLMAVSERYPDLKSNENFLGLQAQLEGTENRIKKSRDDFNREVQTFNTTIKQFPTNFLAGMFGFSQKAYFEATADAQTAPQVQF